MGRWMTETLPLVGGKQIDRFLRSLTLFLQVLVESEQKIFLSFFHLTGMFVLPNEVAKLLPKNQLLPENEWRERSVFSKAVDGFTKRSTALSLTLCSSGGPSTTSSWRIKLSKLINVSPNITSILFM
ncbi:hypothetical protein NE237_003973 [Protea cynaroides]|uniref:Uncharacterized protein n=1 Tax=Protea cynaroides TaxID=273540 RepID=A0A9Q0QT80_9MAGN|nr:hypothetical protein NE237_003973 [Protea cynaroides]